MFVMVGCAGIDSKDVASLDNYSVCHGYLTNQSLGAGGRVMFGVMTLGMTEAFEAGKRSKLEIYSKGLENRGITDCSANGLARFECKALHSHERSSDFKQCVLTLENSIVARRQAQGARAAVAAVLLNQD